MGRTLLRQTKALACAATQTQNKRWYEARSRRASRPECPPDMEEMVDRRRAQRISLQARESLFRM